ncbi:hypothetical protein DEA8626_01258 [Defluviimonas aquaemixtae]|uniref:EF-hand domain-containing protein n=1 Tax=Albidovulum aquaemixtae TaxID=1542388 RepID=A0A2R8B530_9RHOB|nr:calcium-binding protein [Defluviimonas aquaemixtae]SPH17731.1 hypothetical protein DEA8626_01258 [Defluviimonas aquaemixtae]
MKKLAFTLALGLMPAAGALAQSVADLDADGSGGLDMAELQVGYPTLSEDQFAAIDANGDGLVDDAEFTAATEAGTLTTDG